MSTGVTYFWGCVGGFFAAGFVYILPAIVQAALTGDVNITRARALGMAALVTFLSAAAGVIALIPDNVTRGQAISAGFASQTILKGLISGARDALPPST